MNGTGSNRLVITGQLSGLEGLRYTPAGLERMEATLLHASTQQEAGGARQVRCEVPALALGDTAKQLARLQNGQLVTAVGFLAQRSLRNTRLVLHIEKLNLEQE